MLYFQKAIAECLSKPNFVIFMNYNPSQKETTGVHYVGAFFSTAYTLTFKTVTFDQQTRSNRNPEFFFGDRTRFTFGNKQNRTF